MSKGMVDKDCKRSHSFQGANVGADYTDDEREFMMAMEEYKRRNRIRFPTCTDCLTVARKLGYKKHVATPE